MEEANSTFEECILMQLTLFHRKIVQGIEFLKRCRVEEKQKDDKLITDIARRVSKLMWRVSRHIDCTVLLAEYAIATSLSAVPNVLGSNTT